MVSRTSLASTLLLVLLASCGNRSPAVIGDFGYKPLDGAPPKRDKAKPPLPDLPSTRDRPGVFVDLANPDKFVLAPDYGMCPPCKPGEVYLMSPCVPTDKLFTCGQGCNPSTPNTCPPGSKCDPSGGPPCCACSSIVPACVPAPTGPGQVIGPLRITPTAGGAGQSVTIKVAGSPFYVGALFYLIRMGKETLVANGGTNCGLSATFTPPSPGVYAVEVSQYGGGGTWVLAGFYTASGGVIPMPSVQPGYWCSGNPAPGDPTCLSAPPYSCGCVMGRCACK